MSESGNQPREYTGIYRGRNIAELAYLSQTLCSLEAVHRAMDASISFTEPALRSAEAEFSRLLRQNIYFVQRALSEGLEEKLGSAQQQTIKKGE